MDLRCRASPSGSEVRGLGLESVVTRIDSEYRYKAATKLQPKYLIREGKDRIHAQSGIDLVPHQEVWHTIGLLLCTR